MPAKYTHQYRAFGDHVLRAPWMVAEMAVKAEQIKAFAEFEASQYVDSGDYIQSFHASAKVARPSRGSTRRAVGTVENTSDHAAAVEFGTHRVRADGVVVSTPARHTLERAMHSARSAGVAGVI